MNHAEKLQMDSFLKEIPRISYHSNSSNVGVGVGSVVLDSYDCQNQRSLHEPNAVYGVGFLGSLQNHHGVQGSGGLSSLTEEATSSSLMNYYVHLQALKKIEMEKLRLLQKIQSLSLREEIHQNRSGTVIHGSSQINDVLFRPQDSSIISAQTSARSVVSDQNYNSSSLLRNQRFVPSANNLDLQYRNIGGGPSSVSYRSSNAGFSGQRSRRGFRMQSQSVYLNNLEIALSQQRRSSSADHHHSLIDLQNSIVDIAKDQYKCKILQNKIDDMPRQQFDAVFEKIVDYVADLMVDNSGNYLMQKVFERCSDDQRLRLVVEITKDPTMFVRLSSNEHGTRAMQKLIGSLTTRRQMQLVISMIQLVFYQLVKNSNGNHVIQHCLYSFPSEDNELICEVAGKQCIELATHQQGCCVLQKCMINSNGPHRDFLVAKISAHGLALAEDNFGNYAVQYVLDHSSAAMKTLASQFKGNYVHLSRQKCSSNVVEKCLKVYPDDLKAELVDELLSFSHFDQLLQDPYANYVIQTALGNTKGAVHERLVEACRPQAEFLRTNPYCKRIFSRAVFKK